MSAQQRYVSVPEQAEPADVDGMVDLIIVSDEERLGNAPPAAVAVVALVCFGVGLAVGAVLL